MSEEHDRQLARPPRALTIRVIVLGAAFVATVATVVLVLLLGFYGSGSPQDQARLDAVRTAGTIVVGIGGAVALLLAARRQRSAELTLQHQQQVAATAEHDANERRITELYTSAADQLGSDKAPVRLAGLCALERLAQANPSQRQTIVNVVCAYLRMPYSAPSERPAADINDADHARYQERMQEEQVRLTAQRILYDHRKAAAQGDFWTVSIDLDAATLHSAYLPGFDFAHATLYRADLTGADLTRTDFTGADLTATALTGTDFTGANLTGADLDDADLTAAIFTDATLNGALLTGAMWSRKTVWPGEELASTVAEASTNLGDDKFRVGELRVSLDGRSGRPEAPSRGVSERQRFPGCSSVG